MLKDWKGSIHILNELRRCASPIFNLVDLVTVSKIAVKYVQNATITVHFTVFHGRCCVQIVIIVYWTGARIKKKSPSCFFTETKKDNLFGNNEIHESIRCTILRSSCRALLLTRAGLYLSFGRGNCHR